MSTLAQVNSASCSVEEDILVLLLVCLIAINTLLDSANLLIGPVDREGHPSPPPSYADSDDARDAKVRARELLEKVR